MSEPLDPMTLPLAGSRLIEASAGTGKTWTIAALYLRLVLGHGAARAFGPGEILVMTFTKAATRELSDRIRARLVRAAACFRGTEAVPPDDAFLAALLAQHGAAGSDERARAAWRLALAAEAMDDAAVFTIDAWCQRMLREHAFDSGSLFDEELQANETAVREQAVQDVWRQEIYPLEGEALARALGAWPTVRKLFDAVNPLLDKPLPAGAGQGTLAACLEGALTQRAETLAALKVGWVERAAEMLAWLEVLWARRGKASLGSGPRPSDARRWLDDLTRWAGDPSAEKLDLKKGAERLTPAGVREKLNPGAVVDMPPCFEAFEALMQAIRRLPDPGTAMLAHAAARVAARMHELKARAGRYGFADMLDRLDAALDESAQGEKARHLRQAILAQYPAALVDEFQDTSPVQLRIFERLYRIAGNDPATTLLLIGDPKQAIYGFRGADIHSYLQARRATAGRHHTLGTNHRSTKALVEAVNGLFGAAEQRAGPGAFLFRDEGDEGEESGESVKAGEAAADVPFVAVQARGQPRRLVTGAGDVQALTMCLDAQARRAREQREHFAELCAERIVAALGDPAAGFAGELDSRATWQPLRPADIAVLVRTGLEAQAVRRALQARGVASVYLSDKDSVFATDEARDLLRLLQAVAAPRDVRLARAALATRLVDFDLDELRAMAGDDARFDARCELLAELHVTWQQQGVLAMLRRALHGLQMPARWLSSQGADGIAGQRRLTNVMHLSELLQAQSATVEGMQALIRWLAQQVDRAQLNQIGPAEDEQVLRLESDDDLVQVITVHRAKGLEYEWVFLPFATQYRAERPKAFAYLPDAQGRRHLTMPATEAQAEQAELERLREDLRLLYVALTRARQALWVGVGAITGTKATPSVWHLCALGCLVSGPQAGAPGQWVVDVEALERAVPGLVVEPVEPASDADVPSRATRLPPGPPATALRPAPVYTAPIDRSWAVSSYSAIVRGAADETTAGVTPALSEIARRSPRDDEPVVQLPAEGAPAKDAEARTAQGEDAQVSPEALKALGAADRARASAQPWHRFPRGALPGNFLHHQLEWLAAEGFALDSSEELQEALRRRCERQGWGHRADDVVAWLREVCAAPLPGLSKATLATLDRAMPEMEFWFPSDGLHTEAVDALCQRHLWPGRARPKLATRALHGMLMGFADLVLEHRGGYGVLDYKSNALGVHDADYTTAAMEAAMLGHRYDVQAALYLLALHRLLRGRLGTAYAPARHLHGAFYFFLRGVAGAGHGVLHVPAPMPLIEALDRMLAGVARDRRAGATA